MSNFPSWMYDYDGPYEKIATAAENLIGSSFSSSDAFIARVMSDAGFVTHNFESYAKELLDGYTFGQGNALLFANDGETWWNPDTVGFLRKTQAIRGSFYNVYVNGSYTSSLSICLENAAKPDGDVWTARMCYLNSSGVVEEITVRLVGSVETYAQPNTNYVYNVFQMENEPAFASTNKIFEGALKRINSADYQYTYPSWNETEGLTDGTKDNSWEFIRDILNDVGYTDAPDAGSTADDIYNWLLSKSEDTVYISTSNVGTVDIQPGDILIVRGSGSRAWSEPIERHDPIFSIAMGSFRVGVEDGSRTTQLQPWIYRAAPYPYYYERYIDYAVYTFIGAINYIHLSRSLLSSNYSGASYSYVRVRLPIKEEEFDSKVYYYYGDPIYGGELSGATVTKTGDKTIHVVLPEVVPTGSNGAGEKFVSATVNLTNYTENEFDVTLSDNQTNVVVEAYYNSYGENGHKWLIYI